jgi:cytidine deaminase
MEQRAGDVAATEAGYGGGSDATPAEEPGPELFFALVYPVGTDAELVVETLSDALIDVGYHPHVLHLIDELAPSAQEQDVFKRYMKRMDEGNDLRLRCKRPDAFALYYGSQITKYRASTFAEREDPLDRTNSRWAYIIRSLKRPEEIDALRAMYGDALIVLAAHSPRSARSERLTWVIGTSGTEAGSPEARRPHADTLIARDETEAEDLEFGQRVSDAFPKADIFVDANHKETLKLSITRFIDTLFGYSFHTPTRAEYGMFHAQGAALRSADLSRQVGAAIANQDGEIIALGMNEVPKGGGGLYWEDDAGPDHRDFTLSEDVGRTIKRKALRQVLERLYGKGWLKEKPEAILDSAWSEVSGTELMNVTEYGRGVHAEMAAIVDAARRGISVADCTLYTTTFPCHVCARHIVAAGIKQLVYNEPYPKSLARFLHVDSIAIDDVGPSPRRTNFVPFVGLAPHLYVRLFRSEKGARRDPDTDAPIKWEKQKAQPVLSGTPANYIPKELTAFDVYANLTSAAPSEAAPQVPHQPVAGPEAEPTTA